MKTLTLTQPWATLVAIGAKRIDTRSWNTSYRGPLAIHAARSVRKRDIVGFWRHEPFKSALYPGGNYLYPEFQCGSVIATCRLIACVPTRELQTNRRLLVDDDAHCDDFEMTETERAFGDYSPGRWAWLLADIKRLPEPDPARGSRRLWEWDAELYWNILRAWRVRPDQQGEDFGPNDDATTPGLVQSANKRGESETP